VGFCRTVAQ